MSAAFKKLNPLLHFSYIKEKTEATSGNLSIQFDKLAEAGYIRIEKGFAGKKPKTTYSITPTGIEAMQEYVDALKSYLIIPHEQ